MSFGFGFGFPRGGSAGAWSPFSLFANGGVQGAYYDPSYLNTYMSGLGPELVTNGDFTSASGWSTGGVWVISGGAASISSSTASLSQSTLAAVAGKTYEVTFTISSFTAGGVRAEFGGVNGASRTAAGTYSQYFTATSTSFLVVSPVATSTLSVDNISVKEVTTIANATMFTTSAGSTPVTAVEQNVGLILDQSQGLVVGSELFSNPELSPATGWIVTTGVAISGGVATFSSGTTVYLYQDNVPGYGSGQFFEFQVVVSSYTSGSLYAFAGNTGLNRSSAVTAAGTYTLRVSCGTDASPQNGVVGDSFRGAVDFVSCKRVAGNNAVQSTLANRGILRSRFNQLTYSEQFDNAVWTKNGSYVQTNLFTYSETFSNTVWTVSSTATKVSTAVLAPNGSNTAVEISFSAQYGAFLYGTFGVLTNGITYTLSFWARRDSGSNTLSIFTSAGNPISTYSPNSTWTRYTFTFTWSDATAQIFITQDRNTSGFTNVQIWGAQLVQGPAPGNYRATTASALPILYTNPFGGLTAQKLATNSGTASVIAKSMTAGLSYTTTEDRTLSAYAKSDGLRYLLIGVHNGGGYSITSIFDVLNGSFVAADGHPSYGTARNNTIIDLGNGWYRCSTIIEAFETSSKTPYIIGSSTAGGLYNRDVTGDGSSGILILGGQLVPTEVFPTNTYQRIAASTDYATGPAFPLYIQTDGTNDAMLTNTINFANGPSSPPLGPELVTNGGPDFTSTTGWTGTSSGSPVPPTLSIVSGWFRVTPNGTNGGWGSATITYPASWIAVTVQWRTSGGASAARVTTFFPGIDTDLSGTSGTQTFYLAKTGGSGELRLHCKDTTGYVEYRFISVKEMDSAYAPDKMTVTAGVTKLSDAALGMVTELSANLSLNNGSFWCLAPLTTGASADFDISFKGTNQVQVNSGIKLSPVTAVITGASSISTPSAEFIYNGVRTELDTGSQGTGTFGNYPLYLFARGNASLYFNGYFYGAVVVQKFLSAGELASVTNWMEVRTFGKDMSYSYDYLTLDNGDFVTLDNGDPVYTNIYYS